MTTDAAKVMAHIAETVGTSPEGWEQWPGGWPGDIESALVDAVFSARAVYKSTRGRGVYARVVAWQRRRSRHDYSLPALIAEIDSVGVRGWADRFGNHQKSPYRPDTAPLGASKVATVREAAEALTRQDVTTAQKISISNASDVWNTLLSVSGLGYATANYFLMLLGATGVKPDRMVKRFLTDATGQAFSDAKAERVTRAAATRLGVEPHELDHAIWSYESWKAEQRGGKALSDQSSVGRTR
jgi:hypothetical protein